MKYRLRNLGDGVWRAHDGDTILGVLYEDVHDKGSNGSGWWHLFLPKGICRTVYLGRGSTVEHAGRRLIKLYEETP